MGDGTGIVSILLNFASSSSSFMSRLDSDATTLAEQKELDVLPVLRLHVGDLVHPRRRLSPA
jgi:hypothetical protein